MLICARGVAMTISAGQVDLLIHFSLQKGRVAP